MANIQIITESAKQNANKIHLRDFSTALEMTEGNRHPNNFVQMIHGMPYEHLVKNSMITPMAERISAIIDILQAFSELSADRVAASADL